MAKRKRAIQGREKRNKDKERKRQKRTENLSSLIHLPITKSWAAMKRREHHLQLENDNHLDIKVANTHLGHPSTLKQTSPDGNCFFNALSFVLTGTEKFHGQLRTIICDYIVTHSKELRAVLPESCHGDSNKYLQDSSMSQLGTWATEIEIFAAAYLLNINIYIYTKYGWHWKWVRHAPPQPESTLGIYLYHRNLNHYDVVLGVTDKNSETLKKKEAYLTNKEKDLIRKRAKYATDLSTREAIKHKRRCFYHVDLKKKEDIKRKNNERYKNKYAKISSFRLNEKQRAKERYNKNEEFRRRKLVQSKIKYLTNGRFRLSILKLARTRYRQCKDIQNRVKGASKIKYAENMKFRKEKKIASIEKYKNDIKFRLKVRESSKRKYKNNKAFRKTAKDLSKQKYKVNKTFQKEVKEFSKWKYKNNISFRQHVQSYSRRKYKENLSFRQCVKASSLKRYASWPLFRYKLKRYLSEQYHKNAHVRQQKKERVRQRRRSLNKSLQTFLQNVKKTPKFTCIVCSRILFKTQVKICTRSKYLESKFSEIAKRCLIGEFVCDGKQWICFTCDKHLKSGRMPPQALANGLQLKPVPEELSSLNILERQLVALRIPFMKILSLPRGGQKGVKGQVVNVPSNINSVTTSLPRSIGSAQMVKVKLKRKLSYRGHQQYEWIHPSKVREAIKYLLKNNSWYSQITKNEIWFDPSSDSDLVQENIDTGDTDVESDNEQESESYDKEAQTHPVETCSQPIDIGQEYLDTDEKVFCVAPGEGQIPQSIFHEKGADSMAFPALFPDGKFGFSEERPIKLSPSKYFNARLFCADTRFARDNNFIFFAQFMIEMSNIRSNLSIALRKGKRKTHEGKKITASMLTNSNILQQILKADAGFRFLQPVRGSPPYWQRTMKDLYAMIRQLGIPFLQARHAGKRLLMP